MLPLSSHYHRFALCALGYLMITTSCGRKKHDEDATAPQQDTTLVDKPMDEETKRWWIAKANNTLRHGQNINDVAAAEDLQKLAPAEAALKLTSDPAFYDMMADFSGYWLGIKSSKFRENATDYSGSTTKMVSAISEDVAGQRQVVNAVKTMSQGGDYFAGLFQEKGPTILDEVRMPGIYSDSTGDWYFPKKTSKEIRTELQRRLHAEITQFIELAKDGKTAEFCTNWKKRLRFNIGGPHTPDGNNLFDYGRFEDDVDKTCDLAEKDGSTPTTKISPTVIETLISTNDKLDKVVLFIDRLEEQYKGHHPRAVKHVTDLAKLDLSELGIETEGSLYNQSLFFKLQNSSTNRNRRRASWALKRFFCDDLTPINLDAPSSHVGGQHGSDPACQSCHYKLDPMAGYFREMGIVGVNFSFTDTIVFDDLAKANRATYEKPWKAAPESGREWNIGYIRSVTDDSQNTFGSNFKDLLELLKTAPEVKECFVRRAFEYSVGEEQAYDKAWGRSIVAKMNETAKSNPSVAIKQVFIDIATSKAFTARERNNNTCYDFTGNTAASDRAPCRIASILERNCTSCHSGSNRQGGLDLSSWKLLSDQKPGFPHKAGDREIPSRETFQNMIDRLSSTDSNQRMPLMKTMPAPEREELFLWLQKELDKSAKN